MDDYLKKLEAGGSLFELIEFSLVRCLPDGRSVVGIYGVNVAKVREVVRMPMINPLASTIPGVAGIFELRGVPIPAINLAAVLGDPVSQLHEDQQIIVTEFSQRRAGFIVGSTHRIRRVSWEKVLPPTADASTCISGMTLIEGNEFLFILDLEQVLFNIENAAIRGRAAATGLTDVRGMAHALGGNAPAHASGPGNGQKILIVDDSKLVLSNLRSSLERWGYVVVETHNGAEAYELLEGAVADDSLAIDAVITDLEMPKMDGLTLVKKVRAIPEYADLPILVHSSLSGKASIEDARSVGANGYVIKNDMNLLQNALKKVLRTPRMASSSF